MRDMKEVENIEDLVINTCSFWVQLHGLPIKYMTKKVGEALCGRVGTVLEGYWIVTADGKKRWITFQYEKLPDYCFVCGCLTHLDSDCEKAIELQVTNKKVQHFFDSSLRADGILGSGRSDSHNFSQLIISYSFQEMALRRSLHGKGSMPMMEEVGESDQGRLKKKLTNDGFAKGASAKRLSLTLSKGKDDSDLNCQICSIYSKSTVGVEPMKSAIKARIGVGNFFEKQLNECETTFHKENISLENHTDDDPFGLIRTIACLSKTAVGFDGLGHHPNSSFEQEGLVDIPIGKLVVGSSVVKSPKKWKRRSLRKGCLF
ncbi:hypothetical protein PTKIN_Ptkin19aG0027100 [Pterospermum kingtungense]